ncbi:signal peptidase I [uncultured Litoreibacter sp.]|uniref:signal peptidase I n=1 Tax=uncultured Litoreibacter sp. TaxID=1392394 RepID=UPI002607B2A7|nr:signal peptidase I [uncultured Litoreibacter sp.]
MRSARRSEILLLAVLAPFAFVVICIFVLFRAYWIPTGSMKPGLMTGDYLLVSRAAYGFPALTCSVSDCTDTIGVLGQRPARGDVVTFVHPTADKHFIKRIVGMPGDTVQMKEGEVYLNDAALNRDARGVFEETYQLLDGYLPCSNAPVSEGETCEKDQYLEVLPNGRAYLTLSVSDGLRADDTAKFVVPEGHVFVMGDNRDNSVDSRFPVVSGGIGFVPIKNIIGRAELIVFSLKGREGRVFRWVQ